MRPARIAPVANRWWRHDRVRLVRAELRKITTTRLLWGFLAVLALIAALNASLIIFATDADGTKGFIATAEDQRTLLAFGYNALFGTALFGAIAAAREYAHNTIVPTMLLSPRRHVAMLAQFGAVLIAGAVLGLAGGAFVMVAGAISMPFADGSLLLSVGTIAQLLAASAFAGAAGALLGAGLGCRRTQPRRSGHRRRARGLHRPTAGRADDDRRRLVGPADPRRVPLRRPWRCESPGGRAALAAWALMPAAISLVIVQRRDVV
jgi:ABC-2 type transport system permease protein